MLSNPRSANPQLNFSSSNSQAALEVLNGVVSAEGTLNTWQSSNATLTADSDISAAVSAALGHISTVSTLLARTSQVLASAIPNLVVTQSTIAGFESDIASARASVSASNASIQSAVTAQKNAAASLDSAKKNLALKQAGPVQADIDAQAAQVRSAEADLANARSMLNKTTIVAPFTGVVTTMDAKVGLIASPNTPLITMISAGTFQVESYVPEVNIGLVAVNNPASVTLDAYGEDVQFDARVVSIDPAASVRNGIPTYRAILQFSAADARIKSGMTANVVITTAQRENVISVPQGIIVERDSKKYVPVLEGDVVVEKEVTIGAISSLGEAEILTGLSGGEAVVLSLPETE
jgi:HlyD family secretion protein